MGIEPVNFAFITKNGVAHAPANPVDATLATYTPNPTTALFMNPGDTLIVEMHDTVASFEVVIHDLTTGETGSMTASPGNGFGQVKFDPNGTTCQNIPYAFHPMYSTSSEHTRVPWAAHSYNVAFSNKIGHFEYCNAVSAEGGNCIQRGVNDRKRVDSDDTYCFDAAASAGVPIGGCFGTDADFDGVPYQHTWPGTLTDPTLDSSLNPSPIRFTSPLFRTSTGELTNYDRIAFEADLPRIEFATRPPCNRITGAQCVNPPEGANFYPFYTTTSVNGACSWQLGGPFIPGTTNFFGGSSTTEFGSLLQLFYPSPKGAVFIFENFRQILSSNPCLQ